MNSFDALSRACGHINHRTLKDFMRLIQNLIPLISAVSFAAVLTAAPQAPPPSGEAQLATVKQYCSGCPNDKAKRGRITFEGITAATIAKDPERFEKAVR